MGWAGGDTYDPAKGYVAGVKADLETTPARRIIESMARLGKSGYVDVPGKGGKTTRQFFDFTGMGEADVQRQYADKMLSEMLQLQRDFGPQYVQQRLAELEKSDPEGAAMRRQLWDTVQTAATTDTAHPGNEALQANILARLERGSTLDPRAEHEISQQVMGGQYARGNYLGNANANQEAQVLADAGAQQKTQAQQEAMAFLTGGLDPQDVTNRENQQDMANLGAFLAGETPTAQFSQVSGARGGIVPFTSSTGGALPGVNSQAGWQGVNNGLNVFNANQALQQSQVNPWVAGLSGAFNGMNAWASLGGRFGGNSGGQQPMNYKIGTSGSWSGE